MTMRATFRQFQLPERSISAAIPSGEEIFAIGDVHGRADALRFCLQCIGAKPRLNGSRRTIIFLGDIIDRGPDSLGAAELVVQASGTANADLVQLVLGNHELMYIDALAGKPSLWLTNGGLDVLDEVDRDWRSKPLSQVMRVVAERMPSGFSKLIHAAPSHIRVGDLLFVHAGLDPNSAPDTHLDRKRPHVANDTHWAWIRESFLTWADGWSWDPAECRYRAGDAIVIHGHSPAITLPLSAETMNLSPCDEIDRFSRLCLDIGSAQFGQIAWAHFYRCGEETKMQIAAASEMPTVHPLDLFF